MPRNRTARGGDPWSGTAALTTGPRAVASLLVLARALTLTLIGVFASVAGHLDLLSFPDFQGWWLLALLVGSAFSWAQFVVPRGWSIGLLFAEGAATVALVAFAGPAAWPLLIYLMMAPVFVGISTGGWLPVLVAGVQFATMVALSWFNIQGWGGLPTAAMVRLAAVGMLFGLATALVRQIVDRNLRRRSQYVQALTLLEQLSEITRQLPSGLGVDAVTTETLSNLTDATGAAEVAIFLPRGDWWSLHAGPSAAAVLADDPGFGRWSASGLLPVHVPMVEPGQPWGDPSRLRALPLRAAGDVRAVAVARFDGRVPVVPTERLEAVSEEAAARLAASEVYAEVRERATAEERRRVSREIHDGVAQDLAALTYQLDNIAEETGLAPVSEAAAEVRRLVRELRLSIFDLRTDLGSNEALGTAIGEYAQQVAASTGIVVHTTVSEHGAALDPYSQHELLRVCQEAVANARRHSRARNMWITYKNHGGGWLLRVADDGVGVIGRSSSRSLGGEGISIMRERVARIGAQLAVRGRIGGGTVIEVTLDRDRPQPEQWITEDERGASWRA